MPRDRVIEDYLASEMSVRAQSIELYLDWVDQQGGASKLLGERGLSPAEAVALQKRLLCVDAQVGESVRDAQARTSVPMPSA
jgi:hypothetical protein